MNSEVIKTEANEELRCPKCKRLLMKGQVIKVEVKCPKCHSLVDIKQSATST